MAWLRLPSIRSKLLALFLVCGVLPILVVSLISYFNSLKAVEEMVGNRTDRLAQSVAEELSHKLQRRVHDRILAVNRPVQGYLASVDGAGPESERSAVAYDQLRIYLTDLFKEYGGYYDDVFLADDAGDPVFRFHRSEGAQTVPALEWRRRGEESPVAPPAPPGSLAVSQRIVIGERLSRRLEDIGRRLEESGRNRQRALAAVDSLTRTAPPAGPDAIAGVIQEALSAADLNLRIPGVPAPSPAPGPGSSIFSTRAYLPPTEFSENDRRAVRRAAGLADGEVLVFSDRLTSGGARVLRLVMPVYSVDDKATRLGTLVADLRMDYLFPEDLTAERFGAHGELAVVNGVDGEILFHTRPDLVGRNIRQADYALADAFEADRRSSDAPRPWVKVGGPDGARLASTIGLEAVPWTVLATAVPREFESEARRAGLLNLLVATLAFLLAGSVLLYSSRRISRSIQVVTEGAREIAEGNLSHTIHVQTHDEIETLGETFNVMTRSLRENISLREKAARELEALNRTLEDRVQERTHELEMLNAALNQANQELKELDRLKSNFLSTVSHEFRTPLTSIKAFSEILLDEAETAPATAEMKRFLAIINSESDRLGRLIKNLLSLSRLESGRMVWTMSEFALKDVVEAAADGLFPVLGAKNIRLERETFCEDVRVAADRDRVHEVVTNLIENAIKFSEPGGVIRIACALERERGEDGRRRVRVTVRDRGMGVPAAHLERIFERFSQAEDSETRSRGGTGLGLAICKEIVEHHGGRIWVESEPGKGAAFHFTLPVVVEEKPAGETGGVPGAGRARIGEEEHRVQKGPGL